MDDGRCEAVNISGAALLLRAAFVSIAECDILPHEH
jgi:hypothetical protein